MLQNLPVQITEDTEDASLKHNYLADSFHSPLGKNTNGDTLR